MSKTILVVDDFESLRFVTSFPLENKGHKVITASDGKEALEMLESNKVDLIVTDYHMPNMDGISLTKAIRNTPNYKFTPIIMLSTEMQEEVKKNAKVAGITAWIHKPYKLEDFMAVVNRVLK